MNNYILQKLFLTVLVSFLLGCTRSDNGQVITQETTVLTHTSLVVLGTIQDAGMPHIGCQKSCCSNITTDLEHSLSVSCLGIYDASDHKIYMLDATPDFSGQLASLQRLTGSQPKNLIDGIFLTHAHIGHYTGLMYLGKEAKGADQIPVYAMPRMKQFLEHNGPWSQLVTEKNISIKSLQNQESIILSNELSITPFLVPHRDEYSETVGYKIKGPNKSALFIPDIDKWAKWDTDIVEEIKKVDAAYLDATFYSGKELNNRDMNEIPHPFVLESLQLFDTLSHDDKAKIRFIHMNHTNPIVNPESSESRDLMNMGYSISREFDILTL